MSRKFPAGVATGSLVQEIINDAKANQYALPACNVTGSSTVNAAIEALRNGDEDVFEMRESYDQRRRFLLNAFKEMGIECFEPFGAFFHYFKIYCLS